MTSVLITGATGNVGLEVIKSLQKIDHQLDVYASVRQPDADRTTFSAYKLKILPFDFTNAATYEYALKEIDVLFLLRPPHISEVEKYFKPIINACLVNKIKHIVFLSVQGVENSTIIPHHKIEKLIVASKIPYTFLRPAYFMQNFTTTLQKDIVTNKQIYLPAGNAKFTLIDVRDIGSVAAIILANPTLHLNKSYELTSRKKLNFREMTDIINGIAGTDIKYISPNLIRFFITKRMAGTPTMLIFVMIMLHYLPRFKKEPATAKWVEEITGLPPISFEQFIVEHQNLLK